jgi:hypothetical protein
MGGVMLLALSSAVARSLEKDEALWSSVADACSPPLRREIFGTNDYPVGESRNSLSEACHHLGLRNQLNLPGKHRYWRTVLLQFGFSAKVGMERLPFWLTGYGLRVGQTARSAFKNSGRTSSAGVGRAEIQRLKIVCKAIHGIHGNHMQSCAQA